MSHDELVRTPTPAAPQDRFEELVEVLRDDFRRLFPQLIPVEADCFHVRRVGGDSGKVWTEFIVARDGRRYRRRVTLYVEGGRVARRSREESPIDEHLEDTAPREPGSETRGERPAVGG